MNNSGKNSFLSTNWYATPAKLILSRILMQKFTNNRACSQLLFHATFHISPEVYFYVLQSRKDSHFWHLLACASKKILQFFLMVLQQLYHYLQVQANLATTLTVILIYWWQCLRFKYKKINILELVIWAKHIFFWKSDIYRFLNKR